MNAFLFLFLSGLSLVQSQCVSGLIAGFAMDELGGNVLHDSTVLRQNITINSNTGAFSFSTLGNPQGVSSLVLAGGGLLVLQPFYRPPQYTVATWFKSSDQGEDAIFSWIDASLTYTFYARLIQGRVGVALNTILSSTLSYRSYNDGQWHFMAVTYSQDTNMVNIHLDPHLQTYEVVQTMTGTPRAYAIFQIGGMQLRAGVDFSGELDDFRVFNTILQLSDMQRIALQLDTPCGVNMLIPQRAIYQSAIPNFTATTFAIDATQGSVCGVVDAYGRCTNNRYGIALTACSGAIAAVSSRVVVGGQVVKPPKDTTSSTMSCVVSYDGLSYPSSDNVDSARLCLSAPRIIPFASPSNPIANGAVNQITFTSGAYPLRVEVSLIVADNYGSFNPTTRAFPTQTNVVTKCSANYMEARWATPVLNNGLTCNACVYQAWYSPLSKVVSERVNLLNTCGAKLYGAPLPDTFTVPYYNQFVLPAAVSVPGDAYVWVIIASSQSDGVEGVVAVLDGCPYTTPSLAPTMAPTPVGTVFSHNLINSNTLVLNMLAANFPPPRTGFINQFVTSIATILNTDVQRINYTNFTDLGSGKVANGFDILPPVWQGFDNRTAGTLALLLYTYHQDQTSILYHVLTNTDPNPTSFSSNYDAVPVWTATPNATTTFPWQYIVIIIAAILGAICCCCIIYVCYHRTRGRHEKVVRGRPVEIGHTTNIISNAPIRSQRLYNEDEKHNGEHINFPARSPTRGSDLASAKRFATSPETRSDPVSYKGATMNSASDAPHMDPRDWRSVVALHGRNGTVDKGDLVFKIGDVIRVIGPCDGPHWFEGELESTGARGMVPVNHVKGHVATDEVRIHQTR